MRQTEKGMDGRRIKGEKRKRGKERRKDGRVDRGSSLKGRNRNRVGILGLGQDTRIG